MFGKGIEKDDSACQHLCAFYHKHARYGEDCMLFKKEKGRLFVGLLASRGQVSMPTSNFTKT